MIKRIYFTEADEQFIRDNYLTKKYREIGVLLCRDVKSIKNKIVKMGLPSKPASFAHVPKKTHYRANSSYQHMLNRCSNSRCAEWPLYGGRGITVCDSWKESFFNFLSDMGERPEGYTIDRIDPDGNYSPENCRWLPNAEQVYTTRKYLSMGPCKICEKKRGNCGGGRCAKCADYFRRAGKERPLVEDARSLRKPGPGKPCIVCTKISKPRTHGRCTKCNSYFLYNGVDRALGLLA
jgi:hypothetical protein